MHARQSQTQSSLLLRRRSLLASQLASLRRSYSSTSHRVGPRRLTFPDFQWICIEQNKESVTFKLGAFFEFCAHTAQCASLVFGFVFVIFWVPNRHAYYSFILHNRFIPSYYTTYSLHFTTYYSFILQHIIPSFYTRMNLIPHDLMSLFFFKTRKTISIICPQIRILLQKPSGC